MSIQPVTIHVSIHVDSVGTFSTVLENTLPVDFLLDPQIQVWNTSATYAYDVTLTRTLDFGDNEDPESTGTYDDIVVDTSIAAGDTLNVNPETPHMIQYVTTPRIYHTLDIVNTEALSNDYVHIILVGKFDEVLRVNLNNFIRRDP